MEVANRASEVAQKDGKIVSCENIISLYQALHTAHEGWIASADIAAAMPFAAAAHDASSAILKSLYANDKKHVDNLRVAVATIDFDRVHMDQMNAEAAAVRVANAVAIAEKDARIVAMDALLKEKDATIAENDKAMEKCIRCLDEKDDIIERITDELDNAHTYECCRRAAA